MTVSDEELMAHLDGELDAARSESLRREIESSPELAHRVAEQRALRDRLRQAFDVVLDEPVPARLTELLSAHPVAVAAMRGHAWRPQTTWFAGLALAAGLALGIAIGPWIGRPPRSPSDQVAGASAIMASGALADALSRQVASEQPASAPVRIGVSFIAKNGEYCRTFVSRDGKGAMAGMACRESVGWNIEALQSVSSSPPGTEGYRQAGASIPPAIVQAVENSIAGEPLDAAGEIEARNRDWRLPRANQ